MGSIGGVFLFAVLICTGLGTGMGPFHSRRVDVGWAGLQGGRIWSFFTTPAVFAVCYCSPRFFCMGTGWIWVRNGWERDQPEGISGQMVGRMGGERIPPRPSVSLPPVAMEGWMAMLFGLDNTLTLAFFFPQPPLIHRL